MALYLRLNSCLIQTIVEGFPLADVFKTISHCLRIFGPEYVGFSHDNDYLQTMEEEFKPVPDGQQHAAHLAVSRAELIRSCDEAVEKLTTTMMSASSSSSSSSFDGVRFRVVLCRLCGEERREKQSSLVKLLKHLKESHGKASYMCEICSKSFTSSRSLKRHKEETHWKVKTKTCPVCGKVVSDLTKHMRIHQAPSIPCPQCPKMFRHAGNLTVHLQYHLAVKPFHCSLCDKGFSRKQNYERHPCLKSRQK